MARFWIIEEGNITAILPVKTEGKSEKQQKIKVHKAIITALKGKI